MKSRFGPFYFAICDFASFHVFTFSYFLFSTKDGAMYLSFLFLIAVSHSFVIVRSQTARHEWKWEPDWGTRAQTEPDCFFREHSLFYIAVSELIFFFSATVKDKKDPNELGVVQRWSQKSCLECQYYSLSLFAVEWQLTSLYKLSFFARFAFIFFLTLMFVFTSCVSLFKSQEAKLPF